MPLRTAFFNSLRVQIFLHFAALLLIAVLLVNAVVLIFDQEILIQREIEKGEIFLGSVGSIWHRYGEEGDGAAPGREGKAVLLARLLRAAGGVTAIVVDPSGTSRVVVGDQESAHLPALESAVIRSGLGGARHIQKAGKTRGVFWSQKEVLLLSLPLAPGDGRLAAGVVMPLSGVYASLRRTQHIVLIYTAVNTFVLALFGLYRMSRFVMKPIQRLVDKAETYREAADDFFLIEKDDTEFGRLSKSLNRMLMRVSESRNDLKASVASLEVANRRLEAARMEMVRTEKLASVGRLSAGIAHEIGNPLGIISGYLDLLKDTGLPEADRQDFIRRTQAEVDRIHAIIRQLLDLSRSPRSGDITSVSVHGLIRDIQAVWEHQPMFAGTRLELALGADGDTVTADSEQLRQVFLNLMINAVDAMAESEPPENRVLRIDTRSIEKVEEDLMTGGPFLEVRFRDSGPGVRGDLLPDIFDPFFTTKSPGKGTGLGLSVSYMLIEGMGGQLRAENRPEGGLSMIIELPVQGPAPSSATLSASA